jgi:hypothetical protein
MEQMIYVAQRRFDGENIPVTENVFRLFELHTELIMRGRRNKPIEFGHKILISETQEKFITDYNLLRIMWYLKKVLPTTPFYLWRLNITRIFWM